MRIAEPFAQLPYGLEFSFIHQAENAEPYPAEVTGPPDVFAVVAEPLPDTGPVARVLPTGAVGGTGTVNALEGFATGAGAAIGFGDGAGVGGAGFA
jgi:2-keto-3-deoxy-6-phosphogluconate aldolase